MNQTVLGPGIGPYIQPVKCIGYNRIGGAVVLGDVLGPDMLAGGIALQTESSITVAPFGDIGSDSTQPTKCWPWGNLIPPQTANIGTLSGAGTPDPGAWFGAVTSLMGGTGADNTKVELTLYGYGNVKVSAATTFGQELYLQNAATALTPTVTAGVRSIARALSETAGAGTVFAFIDGLRGMGSAIYAS